jgi:hypothetical protein
MHAITACGELAPGSFCALSFSTEAQQPLSRSEEDFSDVNNHEADFLALQARPREPGCPGCCRSGYGSHYARVTA